MNSHTLDVLRRQLAHRYRVLERSLSPEIDAETARRRLGSRPPIAWHARHLWEEIESTRAAVIGDPERPRVELGETRGDPAPDPAGWEQLRRRTIDAATSFLAALATLDDEALASSPLVPLHPAFADSLRTRLQFLEGHLFHVTYHLGAVGLLHAEFGTAPKPDA